MEEVKKIVAKAKAQLLSKMGDNRSAPAPKAKAKAKAKTKKR